MTRDENMKRGGNRDLTEYDQKAEARFDKEVRAKQEQGGGRDGAPRKLGKLHADDGGEHRF